MALWPGGSFLSSFFASDGVDGDEGVVLDELDELFDALEGDDGDVGVVCGLVEGVADDGDEDERPCDVEPVLDDDDELPLLGVVDPGAEFVVVGVFGSPPVERAEALA
jgi:hypothetical protein